MEFCTHLSVIYLQWTHLLKKPIKFPGFLWSYEKEIWLYRQNAWSLDHKKITMGGDGIEGLAHNQLLIAWHFVWHFLNSASYQIVKYGRQFIDILSRIGYEVFGKHKQ